MGMPIPKRNDRLIKQQRDSAVADGGDAVVVANGNRQPYPGGDAVASDASRLPVGFCLVILCGLSFAFWLLLLWALGEL